MPLPPLVSADCSSTMTRSSSRRTTTWPCSISSAKVSSNLRKLCSVLKSDRFSSVFATTFFLVISSERWRLRSRTVGCATAGVNSCLTRLRAVGIEITGTTLFTPKAAFIEPAICLYLGTFISANDSSSTKNAINNVAISAKVAIQAGAPLLQGGQASGDGGPLFAAPPPSDGSSSTASSIVSSETSPSTSSEVSVAVCSSAISQLNPMPALVWRGLSGSGTRPGSHSVRGDYRRLE